MYSTYTCFSSRHHFTVTAWSAHWQRTRQEDAAIPSSIPSKSKIWRLVESHGRTDGPSRHSRMLLPRQPPRSHSHLPRQPRRQVRGGRGGGWDHPHRAPTPHTHTAAAQARNRRAPPATGVHTCCVHTHEHDTSGSRDYALRVLLPLLLPGYPLAAGI